MSRYLHLHVPSSCKQHWNDMVPNNSGRFCLSCQKPVVDFTRMTDAELVSYFKSHRGSQCGRFTQDQVDRNIPIPRSPLPWMKYFFRIALPAFLLSVKSTVQAQKIAVATEVVPSQSDNKVESVLKKANSIHGRITDSIGIAIAGATVMVVGSTQGTVTDTAGLFILNHVDPNATLSVSSIGYETQKIKAANAANVQTIILSDASRLLGDVVVFVGGFVPTRKHIAQSKRLPPADNNTKPIIAYPNPVLPGGIINIRCNKVEHGSYLSEVLSVAGQVVQTSTCTYTKQDKQIAVSIGDLVPGTYFVRLTHQKTHKSYSEQFVVNY